MKKLIPLVLLMVYSIASQAQVSFSIIVAPCHNDGILSATFTGLTPPMQVNWTTQGTTGATIIHTGVSGLTDVLTNYSGGPLTITAIDTYGVTASGSYGGNPPFTICPIVVTGAVCPAADTLTASVCSGGTPPFTYQWYDYITTGITGTANPIPVVASYIFGLTVTDAAGCKYGALVDPSETAYAFYVPSYTATITTTPANCTNGTAVIAASGGGVPPFTYLWSNGATTPAIGSLVMGSYECTVTDAVGCTAGTFGYVTQSVFVFANVTPTPASCLFNDGSISAAGAGGVAPYTYLWNNGATSASQTGLTGGNYDVVVTDANGCTGTGASTVGVSTPVSVTYTATPSLCTTANGTASLTATGGTPPYVISWYTFPAQVGNTAINLISGTYDYSVADATGCTQNGTVYVPPVDIISVSFLSTPALCTLANGTMTAYPSGGISPYTYHWSTGATTAAISGAHSGNYSVTITDNLGCTVTTYQTLPDNSPLGLGAVSTPASCIYTNDGIDSVVAWGGTPPYSYAWSSGGTTRTISALPTGPYWVWVTDAAGCTAYDYYSYVAYDTLATSCYCTIEGTVYNDTNGNCVQDVGEPGIPNIQIHIAGAPLSNVYTYTDANGHYSYTVPAGSYTVSETVLPYYPLTACQLNNIAVTATGGAGCVNTVSFANAMDTVHDMHISTWDYYYPWDPTGQVVTGRSYTQAVIVTNNGTVEEDSIHVGYEPDGQIFGPSFVPPAYFAGSPYWYATDSVSVLFPAASQQFLVNYTVPMNIPVNTGLTFRDTVVFKGHDSTWVNDHTPLDNVNKFQTNTLGIFNSNFKEVNPKGTGSSGTIQYTDSVLEYMVHFQNTGDWQVQNVTVIDTLDNNLDWTTLRPEFQSAPCNITMMQAGTKKIVKFVFNDINLPTVANDAVRSNGMLTYTIHLMPILPVGTQVKNRASIYFDYNAPVVTNSTLNTLGSENPIVSVKNVPAPKLNSFTVYPNPANNSFTAVINNDNATSANMQVLDVTGRVLINRKVALQKGTQNVSVDVTNLASGTYFVSFETNGITQTQKLVILKS